MKLRNKKTGEIIEVDNIHFVFNDGYAHFSSLRILNAYWEDYKPKQPLIKDEKAREIVRAWAEINNFDKVKLLVSPEYGLQFEGGYGLGRITFSSKTLNLDYPKEYTIAELCGEEEE